MPRHPQHPHIHIWKTVCKIPRGRVSTYSTIARLCKLPEQQRLVGYALHNLPPGTDVPWHRVINAKGIISLPGEAGRRQMSLLLAEGIVFTHKEIDLTRFGWPRERIPRGKKRLKEISTEVPSRRKA